MLSIYHPTVFADKDIYILGLTICFFGGIISAILTVTEQVFPQWMWLCFFFFTFALKSETSKEASKYLLPHFTTLCKILYLVLHDFINPWKIVMAFLQV